MNIADNDILLKLQNLFTDEIIDLKKFPKPFPENIESPKAVLLGCDPTNTKYNIEFEYVFALERKNNKFNSFLKKWDDSLDNIGLSFDTIYTQNLCRNYFSKETTKNPIWIEAGKFWITYLKDELNKFNENIPILMSSEIIYKVLLINPKDYKKAEFLYSNPQLIPLEKELNKLNRPLIPFYRHKNYDIKNPKWEEYKSKLIKIFK